MNFTDIGETFGVFLNDMNKIIYNDDWLLRAKVFSELHMCGNAAGLKIMSNILDQINTQLGPNKTTNDAWQMTKFDFTMQVGTMVVDLEFLGINGKSAKARVYLRERTFSTETTVYQSNSNSEYANSYINSNIGHLWTTQIASSAYTGSNCSDDETKYSPINVYGNDGTSSDDDNSFGNGIITAVNSIKTDDNELTYTTSYGDMYKNDYEDRINKLENTIYKLVNNNEDSCYDSNGS